MPEPYEPHIAIEKIHSILQNDGYLIIRPHCYVQMNDRKVDDPDIWLVLEENGKIHSKPEWDDKHQKYKYKVEGIDTAGDVLKIIVNIIEENWRVIAITAFGD
jgi:Domain of unknown function (DUF4258)